MSDIKSFNDKNFQRSRWKFTQIGAKFSKSWMGRQILRIKITRFCPYLCKLSPAPFIAITFYSKTSDIRLRYRKCVTMRKIVFSSSIQNENQSLQNIYTFYMRLYTLLLFTHRVKWRYYTN